MRGKEQRWLGWPTVLVIWLAFLGLYAQAASFEYVFDDITAVRDNPAMDLPLSEALLYTQHEHHGTVRSAARQASHDSYRPLRHLSLWVDQQLFGKGPGPAHIHNLIAGSVAIWLVWFYLGSWPLSPATRAMTTAWFALHPVQVESVAYVSGRSDVEAAICALCCLIFSGRFLENRAQSSPPPEAISHRAWMDGGLGAFFFLLCLAQKEAYVLLPLLLLFRAEPGGLKWTRRHTVFVALAVASTVTWFTIRNRMISDVSSHDFTGAIAVAGSGLRQAVTILLAPVDLSSVRPMDMSLPWIETGIYGAGGLVLVVLAFRARSPLVRTACFGAIWFCLLVGPSLVAAFYFEVFSDHYLYLPALGLFLSAGAGLEALLKSKKRPVRRAVIGAWGTYSVWLVLITATTIPYWKNPKTHAELAVHNTPESGRGWVWLADATLAEHGCRGALKYYQTAVSVDPDYGVAWSNIAACALERGNFSAAHDAAKKAILIDGSHVQSWFNYGVALEGLRRLPAACNAYKSTLALHPEHKRAREAVGRVCQSRR